MHRGPTSPGQKIRRSVETSEPKRRRHPRPTNLWPSDADYQRHHETLECLLMRYAARSRHRSTANIASATILALLAIAYAAPAAPATSTQTVKDAAHLHLISGGGTALTEQGKASGTIPGTVRVWLTLHAYTATASFTIYSKAGNISGHATGKLKFSKNGYDSFAGAATINHGTGRYARASGSGTFYGSVYRGNYNMSVQVYGQLRY